MNFFYMWSILFNHSKYETVTPPAFISMSGNIVIPFFNKISSPAIVVGPLAASDTILHWNLSAFFLLIVCSNAAGIKTSQG